VTVLFSSPPDYAQFITQATIAHVTQDDNGVQTVTLVEHSDNLDPQVDQLAALGLHPGGMVGVVQQQENIDPQLSGVVGGLPAGMLGMVEHHTVVYNADGHLELGPAIHIEQQVPPPPPPAPPGVPDIQPPVGKVSIQPPWAR
jgi:hypothetical protein